MDLHGIDSLWVRVPYLKSPLPAASFWQLAGSLTSVVGSLLIAYLVYSLARRQFRSNRWHDQQLRRYTAVVNELVTIRDAAAKLARYDVPGLREEDITVTYTPKEKEEFHEQIRRAHGAIGKEVHRGVFLLSATASQILEIYVRRAESLDRRLEDHPDLTAYGLIEHAYREFYDIAQRDLGAPGLWLAHRKAGIEGLRQRLEGLWWPWGVWRFKTQMNTARLQRLAKKRGIRPHPAKPPQSLGKKVKNWIIENLTIH